ncbi:hypothetical protein V8F20_007425 [Naviculisporaceae sp. PSN 640]
MDGSSFTEPTPTYLPTSLHVCSSLLFVFLSLALLYDLSRKYHYPIFLSPATFFLFLSCVFTVLLLPLSVVCIRVCYSRTPFVHPILHVNVIIHSHLMSILLSHPMNIVF